MAIALEFENAVAEVLIHKTKKALEEFGVQTLIIGGGVSANTFIKSEMQKMINQEFPDVTLLVPEKELTGDNALMIALAGYFKIKKDPRRVYENIKAEGNLSF
jgi:N6-L-threonylcarbamoyladenine synthase